MGQDTDSADEDLIDRYYGCDEAAFTELTAHYRQRLVVFFRRAVSAEDAEDLAQETLLCVARTKQTGKGRYDYTRKTRFETWLFSIAVNRLRTFWRNQRRRRKTVGLEVEAAEQAVAGDPAPCEWQGDQEDFSEAVRACLEALTPRLCESILLDIRGFDLTEVADTILGIPYGTAGSRLHNARQQMTTCLLGKGYRLIPRTSPVPEGARILLVFPDELLIYVAPLDSA
jgi:RNA polymerase sigma-70 factor (ECF subfamily)